MIGNNSWGSTAQRTGKVVDNVASLEVLLYDGRRSGARPPRLPRVRAAEDDMAILADGSSCRTPLHELDSDGREAVHLAELLVGDDPVAPRPSVLGAAVRAAALMGTALMTAGVPALVLRRRLRR